LGDKVSASVTAGIIEVVCLYALQGPDHFVSQLTDPATAWQSALLLDAETEMISPRFNGLAPLLYSETQDCAVGIAYGMVGIFPPHSPNHCLAILKMKPRIIDILFDIAILDRSPRNPQSQIGMVACKLLAILFQWPSHVIPGVPTPLDKVFKAQEWKAMLQEMSILTSLRDWTEKLIEVWMHVEEEDLQGYLRSAERVIPAPGDPPQLQKGGIEAIYGDRGTSYQLLNTVFRKLSVVCMLVTGSILIIVLRLISTLTYAAESCGITNAQVESLLHIAYRACINIKPAREYTSRSEIRASMEFEAELFLYPTDSGTTEVRNGRIVGGVAIETPFVVAPQCVLGPTALLRLLVVLAQRKALAGIQTLKKAPAGLSPSTSLGQIQQITHPDIIRRIIKFSQSRILDRTERGRQRLREKKDATDVNFACTLFATSAELAAALVAFDMHTEGAYSDEARGARKQLVIALGNASQMALDLGHYQRALHYGCAAVMAAENIHMEEGLDPAVNERNQRRVEQANAGLQRRS